MKTAAERGGWEASVSGMEEAKVLGVRARVARTFLQRSRGLIGRPPPPHGEGMLITKCSAIHTFFMSYPIDATFIDSAGRPVRTVRDIPPWRPFVWGGLRARAVLETAAAGKR